MSSTSAFGISVVNIHDGYQGLLGEVRRQLGDVSRDTEINLAPRLRMATLYAVAQSNNGRVANTCNLSEDWVGYSTRYGDSAGDFSPLSMLCVREVKALGRELGLPECLVEKVPIDGLCGQTDEEKSSASPMLRWMPISATASSRTPRQRRASTACASSTASRCALWTCSRIDRNNRKIVDF